MRLYRILICEVNIQKAGHWLSYNQYILDNFQKIEKANPRIHIMFLFNKDAEELLELEESFKDRVYFLNDNVSFYSDLKTRYLLFKKIKKFAEARNVDHIILDFDRFQLPIFLSKFKFNISGILYRPHHRISSSNKKIRSLFINSLKRYKKRLAEKILISQNNVKSIFILNDVRGVGFLNRFYNCSLFKFLPEPVFSYPKNTVRHLDIMPKQSYRYLIFGSMDERKNITNILKAYDQTEFCNESEIIIAGPADKEFLQYLTNLINTLPSIDKVNKNVLLKPGFYSGEEMDYFFSISDVCLLIYKNHFGSSALLGRSAFHKVKVVGSNVGLLNEIIHEYRLGITSDPDDIKEISDSLKSIQNFEVDDFVFEDFYKKNSPEVYLKTLLEMEG